MSKIHLTIIDPQHDFMYEGLPTPDGSDIPSLGKSSINGGPFVPEPGKLAVGGAQNDGFRLANMISKGRKKIDEISVTMDSHRVIHIAHPFFWRDENGNMPTPFSIIDSNDVIGKNPRWRPYNPGDQKWCENYVTALEKKGRNKLCIWPPHCLIGSHGWQVFAPVFNALREYEEKEWATINWIVKGDDPYTEWYSAVQADVEIPKNPKTMINTDFIESFKNYDLILIAGEALSHCIRFSFEDIFTVLGDKAVKKFMLVTDTTSPVGVPQFVQDADDFVKKYTALGMQKCTTDEFIASV